jgi:hypothetical protein
MTFLSIEALVLYKSEIYGKKGKKRKLINKTIMRLFELLPMLVDY